MKLLGFSCVCTYVPNSSLQCLLYVILCPVIIALGIIVACTPSLWMKLFSQNTQLYTILMINCGRYLSNGSVLVIPQSFFKVQMYLLSSGMCSLAVHILSMIPFCSIICCICLNCPSASTIHVFGTLALHVQLMLLLYCFSCLRLVLLCWSVYSLMSSLQMVSCWWTLYQLKM